MFNLRFLRRTAEEVECPFCHWKGDKFLPFGVIKRENAKCPSCGSLERHRLYYLYLKKNLPKDRKISMLHFAPEKMLSGLFRSYSNIDYLSADIMPGRAMVKEDITATSFPDDQFDLVFCSHVLEHIDDDIKAMKEIRRILKPGAYAILQVPIKDIDETYEDLTITDPAIREKVFGQKYHVRNYGRDYVKRLESAGFTVKVDKFADSLSRRDIKKYSLLLNGGNCSETEGWIYLCYK